MQNEKIQVLYYEKGNFSPSWKSEDVAKVYKDLAEELINKKINACTYIKSIRREQLYNGFINITVLYDHGGKRIYTINNC